MKINNTDSPTLEPMGEPVLMANNAPYCAFTDILRLPSGEPLVVYDAGRNHLDEGMRIELRRSSDDGGRTWSEPSVLTDKALNGVATCNHAIELADRRLMISVHGSSPADPGEELLGVMTSNDRGETWDGFVELHRESPRQGMECELAQRDDGRIIALIRRTDKELGLRFESADAGKTWSGPEKVPVGHAPGILVDGGMMLVNHRTFPDGEPRENTTGEAKGNYLGKGTVISLSLDAGKTFAAHLPLGFPVRNEFGGDTAYGGSVKLADGSYFTTYYSTVPGGTAVFGQRLQVKRTVSQQETPVG